MEPDREGSGDFGPGYPKVLQVENTLTKVSAKFYNTFVQAVLLYGSKMWNLTNIALAQLQGFHIRAAYHMAKKHKPKKVLNHVWVYPLSKDVLKECGMHTILHYWCQEGNHISIHGMVDWPIYKLCWVGERKMGLHP